MATRLTFVNEHGTWTRVTMNPGRYQCGVFAVDSWGGHIALAWTSTEAEAVAKAAEVRAKRDVKDVIVRPPSKREEVPARLARKRACGIEWEN